MKKSVTLTFTGLFIVVTALYLYYGAPISKPTLSPISERSSLKLLNLEKEDLTLIQIQKPGTKESVTVVREEGKWQLKHPVNYLADQMMMDGLSMALRISNKARRLNREKGWEEYGLAKPQLKIGIEAKGWKQRRYLLLGDDSPVTAMIFARWKDEPDYFLLDGRFKESFDRSLYSLREKKLIRLSLNDLQKIHVRTFKENYEVSKEKGQWLWTEPIARLGNPAPKELVYEVLLGLRELYVKDFLDDQPIQETEQGFSVSDPYIQVWDKNEKTATVRFGKEVPQHDAYYGMIEGEKVLLEIARGNIRKLFKLFDEPESPKEHPDA